MVGREQLSSRRELRKFGPSRRGRRGKTGLALTIAASAAAHLTAVALLLAVELPSAAPPSALLHDLELASPPPTLHDERPLSIPQRRPATQLGDPAGAGWRGALGGVHEERLPGTTSGKSAGQSRPGDDLDDARFRPYRRAPAAASRLASVAEELRPPPSDELSRIPKDGEVDQRAEASGAGADGRGQGGSAVRRGSRSGALHGAPIWLTTGDQRYVDYFRRIYKKVQPLWVFPKRLEVEFEQGEVLIQFTILADGSARNLRVRKSSGYRQFDVNVLAAVERASPFGPIPRGLGRRLEIVAPFEFANPMIR
jgi:TonB family protein